MSLGTSTIEKSSTSTVRKLAPRYKVLLHNDDSNSMEFVVEVLMQTIAGMTQPQAVNIMMETHEKMFGDRKKHGFQQLRTK